MKTTVFLQKLRSNGPVVTPVIHVLNVEQTAQNIDIALAAGVAGVFLINHDFPVEPFLPIVRAIRKRYPDLWLGVNFLAVTGEHAFPVLDELQAEDCRLDAYWADDACIDEHATLQDQTHANRIQQIRQSCHWDGLYFGGTCFKKQREVSPDDYGRAARLATHFMDVVCTSGYATGVEAELGKIKVFRDQMGKHLLALASGITPENASTYSDVDCFLVATGINRDGDFYNIDEQKIARLMNTTQEIAAARRGKPMSNRDE